MWGEIVAMYYLRHGSGIDDTATGVADGEKTDDWSLPLSQDWTSSSISTNTSSC